MKRQATYSLQRECRSGLPAPKVFTVLGIETSCGKKDEKDIILSPVLLLTDDTAVAIVNSNGDILSNYIHSQVKLLPLPPLPLILCQQHRIHEKYGGIVPSLAMESHQKTIKLAVSEAISRAGFRDVSEIDGIAVTRGPGLEICLRVGLQEAQVSE